jgi:hypothetical protein
LARLKLYLNWRPQRWLHIGRKRARERARGKERERERESEEEGEGERRGRLGVERVESGKETASERPIELAPRRFPGICWLFIQKPSISWPLNMRH